ncbi:alpha/beta fold hydrolase [Pseudoduganella danionis]|uniref:Alpha/beta fold hydrolase n=2 Tax=Pseudoduganella danionis TaxID=1890295 RepID=A0ABW9SPX0_9BURK|nr:alpha/beta fold hydrolase [Pseudoduganella danionis]
MAQERAQTPAQPDPAGAVGLSAKLGQFDSTIIEYAEHRSPNARATIVFENGLLLDFSTWNAVAAGLKQCCNLLFYNRPGVGRSVRGDVDPSPEAESLRLHQLLKERGFSPPYVLVGHSLGGQYVQAYAKRYPEQVDGMVLVDALPLGVVKPYSEFPWFTRFGLWIFASKAARQEIANIDLMGKYVMEPADFYRKPVIRIVAQSSPQQHKPQGLIKDLLSGVIYAEDFGVWAIDPDIAEGRMSGYYPQAEVRSLSANHRIQEQYPAVVIDAITSLIKNQPDVQAALGVVSKEARQ